MGQDVVVMTLEDTLYVVKTSDFGFRDTNDAPSDQFAAVKITSLPLVGSLTNDGKAVSAGQLISVADIDGSKLQFMPASNGNGIAYASFTFQVQDNGSTVDGGVNLDPTPNTVTINVTPVNDPPSGVDKYLVLPPLCGSVTYRLTLADFAFTDPNDNPPNQLAAVRITRGLDFHSSLIYGDGSVSAWDRFISAADIAAGKLMYKSSNPDFETLAFRVKDDGGTANGGVDTDPSYNFISIAKSPGVAFPPFGADSSVSTLEDTPYVFNITDFPFFDENGNHFNDVIVISSLPQGGLRLSGVVVQPEQAISVADIASGNLTYWPLPANGNGPGFASIFYVVQDDTGCSMEDVVVRTLTVSVLPVNDAPTFTTSGDVNATDEGGPYAIADRMKNISVGPSDEAGQKMHFEVSNDNAALFATQPTVDASGKLTFATQVNLTGSATVSVVAVDDGGTASGGVDRSVAQTFTIDVSLAFPLHNRTLAPDVDGDGKVVAQDVVDVINYINAHDSGPIVMVGKAAAEFYDVTGDDYVAADDVVTIINHINAHPDAQQSEVASQVPYASLATSFPLSTSQQPSDALLLMLAADAATGTKRRR
jgi:hypothetical protein